MSLTGSCFSPESAPGALPSWDTIRRLPGRLMAVDIEGDDMLKLARHFFPPTQVGTMVMPTGEKKYRLIYSLPRGGAL